MRAHILFALGSRCPGALNSPYGMEPAAVFTDRPDDSRGFARWVDQAAGPYYKAVA